MCIMERHKKPALIKMEQLQLLLNKICDSAYMYCQHTCSLTSPPTRTATTIKM